MADLDDFFAKKDRKKGKSSKKFSTTDEVAKKLEDNAKKTEKKKERAPEGDDPNAQQQEQDEWKDFEEEKKDYSGLKIGNLTINPATENSSSSHHEGNLEQQEGGEGGQDYDRKNAGPWKRMEASGAEQPVPEPEPPKPVEKKPELPPVLQRSTYVPPSMRNQGPGGPPSMQHSRFRSRAAPDIHNEDFFPTLAKSSESKKNRSEGSFEVVQHNRASGYRQMEQSRMSSSGPRLNLGNRYNTLSNDS